MVNIYGGNSADFVIRAGTLEKYNGAATEVVIPNSVTSIGKWAFHGCGGLTSVTIPNSVTSIGESAFSGCSGLTSMTIPDGVTSIEGFAFNDCKSLEEITISKSVERIDLYAFARCTALKVVTILGYPNLDSSSFLYDNQLTTINASEEWKIENWWKVECLKPYNPNPPSEEKSQGCYIATAVYGSYDCHPVWTLRRYRDELLAKTLFGRAFIHCYYAISPHLVRWFGDAHWFQSFWKARLDKLVDRLNREGITDTPYHDRQW